MQAATNGDGLSFVNFGMGSPNAATVMDLLTARQPKGVLFLGKCAGRSLPAKREPRTLLTTYQFVAVDAAVSHLCVGKSCPINILVLGSHN